MISKLSRSVALLTIGAFLAVPASSIEFRAGQNVTIAEGEVIDDDLYVTGEIITIRGTVRGDVVAAGREITFDGAALGALTTTLEMYAAGRGGEIPFWKAAALPLHLDNDEETPPFPMAWPSD